MLKVDDEDGCLLSGTHELLDHRALSFHVITILHTRITLELATHEFDFARQFLKSSKE